MIKRAVQKEADLFRVGCKTGPTILFHISGVKELELRYYIHPYHTCSNLYASVAAASGVAMECFQLYYQKDGDLQRIIGSLPLSMIIQGYEPIFLRMEFIEAIKSFAISPYFTIFHHISQKVYKMILIDC
jgi:hypothetical protein